MARAPKTYEIVVEGRGTFPSDMLRYDRGQFKTPEDEALANAADTRGRRRITIVCLDRPTVARWESFFPWKVVEQ